MDKKRSVLMSILVILTVFLIYTLFFGESVSAICTLLPDCSGGVCPLNNQCPRVGGARFNFFRTYTYDALYNICSESSVVTCDISNQCQTFSCLDVSFYTDPSTGECTSSNTCPGVASICAYTHTQGKNKGTRDWVWASSGDLAEEIFSNSGMCNDGFDNDCDGFVDAQDPGCCVDADADGYNITGGAACGPIDCADGDNTIYPGATEVCDGIDNDCFGGIDDNLTPPPTDNQNGICSGSTKICTGLGGWQNNYTNIPNYEPIETLCTDTSDNDCNSFCDTSSSTCSEPGVTLGDPNCEGVCSSTGPEDPATTCGDGIDNDCNNQKDWDSQIWASGFPMGIPDTSSSAHGDINCPVGVFNIILLNTNPLENTLTEVYCNTSYNSFGLGPGLNSVNAYVEDTDGSNSIECTPFTTVSWPGSFAHFNCPTGPPGTKRIACRVNQSRSYNSTGEVTLQINVEASPIGRASSCSDYKDPVNCSTNLENLGIFAGPWNSTYSPDPECKRRQNGTGCFWDTGNNKCGVKAEFEYHPANPGTCVEPPVSCNYLESRTECSNQNKFFEVTYTPIGGSGSECALPKRSLICPSTIALPFFSPYNAISVIVIIGLVYLIYIRKTNKKHI